MVKSETLTDMQRNHMNADLYDRERERIHASWFAEDTVDFWRHARMYRTIAPLATFYGKARWMSVGDGRFGLDSVRLKRMFGLDVYPTDIAENMLKKALEIGVLREYGIEDIERLSLAEGFCDVIFCKEALHHLARPLVGLYEMLRVAAEVVVLIGPVDDLLRPLVLTRQNIRGHLKAIVRILLGRETALPPYRDEQRHNIKGDFEPSGNFVYRVSNREINKVVHALDLGGMAYYPFNDAYETGVEFEKAEEGNALFQRIREGIANADRAGEGNLCTTVIFKNRISAELKENMTKCGFIFPDKTDNPYL